MSRDTDLVLESASEDAELLVLNELFLSKFQALLEAKLGGSIELAHDGVTGNWYAQVITSGRATAIIGRGWTRVGALADLEGRWGKHVNP